MAASRPQARVTIADVARRAGVSTATVSRVINQTAPVAPATAAEVRAAITELNFRPHPSAQALASRQTHTLGLYLPEISGAYFAPMLRGIEAGARESGFSLLIHCTADGEGDGHAIPYPLGEHNTDGVMVFVDSVSDAELARLDQFGFPVVLIHRSSPTGLDIPCVTIENKQGARTMVDHLVEVHGYRRIAFLTGREEHEDAHWREMGYREGLAAHGLPFDPQLVACGGFEQLEARNAIECWLLEGVEFDAVFAGDDESAIGVLEALRRAGRRVPEEVAVVGFDDMDLSRYLNPPLTTVRAPIEQVGREAIKQLVRLIQSNQANPLMLLPTELVIRKSCGCP